MTDYSTPIWSWLGLNVFHNMLGMQDVIGLDLDLVVDIKV